jgi:Protein of unknown function (DUF2924)
MPAKSRKTTSRPRKPALPKRTTTPAAPIALTPGTVLRKTDRNGKVRCECAVEPGGYRYEGKLYGSLSGAAAAAAKAVGLSGTSFNGYVFWGLSQPAGRDPLHRVEHLWRRYSNATAQALKAGGPEKAALLARLRQHAAQIKSIAD